MVCTGVALWSLYTVGALALLTFYTVDALALWTLLHGHCGTYLVEIVKSLTHTDYKPVGYKDNICLHVAAIAGIIEGRMLLFTNS